MNCSDDRLATLRFETQLLDDSVGTLWIEATSRFIEQKNGWFSN